MFMERKECFEKVGVKLTQLMIVGQTGTVQREKFHPQQTIHCF